MTFDEFKAKQNELTAECTRTGEILRSFPRLPNGLHPDEVKFSPEFKLAKRNSDIAFNNLRDFNGKFAKLFRR
jgi:hypothetical protein